MPKSTKNFKTNLYGWLESSGFSDIKMLDFNGANVLDLEDADQFRFRYRNGPYDYGTVGITIDNGKLTVWYNESAVTSNDKGIDSNWTEFMTKLKDWSLRNGISSFEKENLDKLGIYMKKKKKESNSSSLVEGWWGNKHTSYSDGAPTVKLVIKHSRAIGEGDQRYHHIEKMFLENELGERILVPSRKPSVGRAFARHLAEGGQYNDERWRHIKELADDINNLGGFVRATRGTQFNESAGMIVQEAGRQYSALRETMRRLSGSKGYSKYFESWQPSLMECGDADYEGLFTSSVIDPRIVRALPTLSKLNIGLGPVQEAEEFKNWADGITEEVRPEEAKKIDKLTGLLSSGEPLPVGADAYSIKGQLQDLLATDSDQDSLGAELEELARSDPDNDGKPTVISWLQKNRNDAYYGRVLDKVQPGGTELPKQPTTKVEQPKEKIQDLMPAQFESSDIELAAIRKLARLK